MKERIDSLTEQFSHELAQVVDSQSLESLRVKFLGRKGLVHELMQDLKACTPEERPKMGKWVNDLKTLISNSLDERKSVLNTQEIHQRLEEESIDVTEPGRRFHSGSHHPLTQMLDEVRSILIGMGFSIQYAPEIDSEYYNYWGLNFPADHPALDMQDTFYLGPDTLLRSHTTNIQQHIMEKHKPPIRVVCTGKCYRNETITSRSHVLFHQLDPFYIDKNVTMADLLATLKEFYSKVFCSKVEMRVRASYFPFVEPGIEVDIKCTVCKGSGCRLCKETGWLEVCGAGMIHPEVLRQGGLDPDEYSGFAWGGGVERLFQLRHGVKDIRQFTTNDMRFLSQFS